MDIQSIICGMQYKIAEFKENYLEERDEDTGFEEVVSELGEPLDEKELDILANSVLKILERRLEVLELSEKVKESL